MTAQIITAGEGPGALATFNYTTLDMETRITVQGNTRAIKERMARTAQDIADIGGYLADTRARLEHGLFLVWLAAEFDMSERTAYNYIAVNERFKSANFAEMSVATSALYLLAAPSTPEAAREEALQRASAGETITHQKAQEIVTVHKPPARPRSAGGGGGGGGGGSGGGKPQQRSASAPVTPPPPLFPLSDAPSLLTPLTPLASTPPALTPLTPLTSPTPAPPAPAMHTQDTDEIAVLDQETDDEDLEEEPEAKGPAPLQSSSSTVIASATPAAPAVSPPAIAGGEEQQQVRLLRATEHLLVEMLQQTRRQLDELRGRGIETGYSIGVEGVREPARQLLQAGPLREWSETVAMRLRLGSPSHSLAEILRAVRAMETGSADLAGLDEVDRALESLASELSDHSYEQLALRTYELRQRAGHG